MTHLNTIMTELPTVFLQADLAASGSSDRKGLLLPLKADGSWVDSIAHLSQFYGQTIPSAMQEVEEMLVIETDPQRQAVLMAAIARCYISQMKLTRGAAILGSAWQKLQGQQNDHSAFVLLEMVRFLVITGNTDNARLMLQGIPAMTKSEYLLRLARYYRLADQIAQGHDGLENELRDSAEWFQNRGQIATVISHYRMMAALCRSRGEQNEAMNIYLRGLQLTTHPEVQFCRALLHNDMGLLLFDEGRPDEAYSHLNQALGLAEFPYSRIDTLDLIGRCLMRESRFDEAEGYLAQALDIAHENGTMIIVPALSLYLAQCHEALATHGTARHFYQKAWRSAVELMENGFPATATRLQAIREAMRYLKTQVDSGVGPRSLTLPDGGEGSALGFSDNFSLKDMRTIFQHALLEAAKAEHHSQQKAAQILQFSARSAGNVQRRYRELGSPESSAELISFVQMNNALNWKQINVKFDDCLLLHLHREMGGKRKDMSERLQISYPHLSSLLTSALEREKQTSERSSHETV